MEICYESVEYKWCWRLKNDSKLSSPETKRVSPRTDSSLMKEALKVVGGVFFFFLIFIVNQLQLYAFSPHPSTQGVCFVPLDSES